MGAFGLDLRVLLFHILELSGRQLMSLQKYWIALDHRKRMTLLTTRNQKSLLVTHQLMMGGIFVIIFITDDTTDLLIEQQIYSLLNCNSLCVCKCKSVAVSRVNMSCMLCFLKCTAVYASLKQHIHLFILCFYLKWMEGKGWICKSGSCLEQVAYRCIALAEHEPQLWIPGVLMLHSYIDPIEMLT